MTIISCLTSLSPFLVTNKFSRSVSQFKEPYIKINSSSIEENQEKIKIKYKIKHKRVINFVSELVNN